MERAPIPYRKTAFVCVHARADGRVACGNPGRGGPEVLAALKDGVKAAGLQGRVRVARSGCLDLCEQGPNVFLHPDNEWFSGVTPANALALLKKLTE